jgi:hypothetical protein
LKLVSGIPSGGLFPVGTSTVVSKATDLSGNCIHLQLTVTVEDHEGPIFAILITDTIFLSILNLAYVRQKCPYSLTQVLWTVPGEYEDHADA